MFPIGSRALLSDGAVEVEDIEDAPLLTTVEVVDAEESSSDHVRLREMGGAWKAEVAEAGWLTKWCDEEKFMMLFAKEGMNAC